VDAEGRDLGPQRFHPALDPELGRCVGRAELEAREAGARRDRDDVPGVLAAHHGQDGARDVHRADEGCRQLPLHLLWSEFLEEAGVEVAGVVDEDVDASEGVDRGLDRGFGVLPARDVELDDEEVVVLAEGSAHGLRVATGRDDRVASREGCLRDVHAHPASGTGDEPDLLGGHRFSLMVVGWCAIAIQPPHQVSRKARVIGVLRVPPTRGRSRVP